MINLRTLDGDKVSIGTTETQRLVTFFVDEIPFHRWAGKG
jgi:hypothetical protein